MDAEPEGLFCDGVKAEHRPVYVLRLRPEPWVVSNTRALRALLKIALRTFGLRCLSIKQEPRG